MWYYVVMMCKMVLTFKSDSNGSFTKKEYLFMSMSFSVSMMGRFLNGLVLVVVFGLELTTSYKIDDPFASEWDKDSVQDMTDEMKRMDELNDKKKREDFLEEEWSKFEQKCFEESESKIPEKEIAEKKAALEMAINKQYQFFQHGKGSIASDESWLAARRSEVCSACVLEKLCDEQAVLDFLGIDSNR